MRRSIHAGVRSFERANPSVSVQEKNAHIGKSSSSGSRDDVEYTPVILAPVAAFKLVKLRFYTMAKFVIQAAHLQLLDEPPISLDADTTLILMDNRLSQPTHNDLAYTLKRWSALWR